MRAGLVYDAGALIAAEGNDRRMWVLHRRALLREVTPTVPAAVVAQVWRGGPQPLLSRLLSMCDVVPLTDAAARAAGRLLARAATADTADAAIVDLAVATGSAVVTSDVDDIKRLAAAAGLRVATHAV